MKNLLGKLGKYDIATFIVMGSGIILFLLTPLLLWLFDFDSDVLGLLIFLIGLVMYIGGLLIRFIIKKARIKNS